MNALSLYVTTCRLVLQSGADDASAWADISRLLSCLRESLTCSVCGKLLNVPTSTVSSCRHNACKSCISGEFLPKPPCEKCTDFSQFVDNVQLRLVIQCYRKLCEYIFSSSLHRKWSNMNGGTIGNLAEIVQEGASEYQSSTTGSGLGNADASDEAKNETSRSNDNGSVTINGNGSAYSETEMVCDSNSTKLGVKRTSSDTSDGDNHTSMETASGSNSVPHPEIEPAKVLRPKRRGCRCGLATRNPGQLTCCGQRCLCYVDRRACDQCRCRGCRNPNKLVPTNESISSQSSVGKNEEIELYVESTVETNGTKES